MIRRTVIFRGTVQGVGFRWTVLRLAAEFRVGGTVRNCGDGSVELVAEGQADEVSGLVVAIAGRMGDTISETSETESQATGEFGDFRVIG